MKNRLSPWVAVLVSWLLLWVVLGVLGAFFLGVLFFYSLAMADSGGNPVGGARILMVPLIVDAVLACLVVVLVAINARNWARSHKAACFWSVLLGAPGILLLALASLFVRR